MRVHSVLMCIRTNTHQNNVFLLFQIIFFLFLFQIPESNANCLIESFLQQLRRVYLVPPEFDGNVIRNMVVVFFLNNLDEYKVSVTM